MKAALLLIALAGALAQQTRDAVRPTAGTAVLAGTVVIDGSDGEPVRRAMVTVIPFGNPGQIQTTTDETGRFVIAGLPASSTLLLVSKPGYPTTPYGARTPGSTVGLPIVLKDGEATNVTVRLPKGAVIAGVVTDTTGRPMSSVGVRVQRVTVSLTGERRLTSTSAALIPSTDDRGAYRVFGLPAGDYIVSAQPRLAANAEVRQTTDEELRWAERELRMGGAAAGTGEAATPQSGQTVSYAPVYYPGVLNASAASIVTIGAGQERAGIDLRMQFIPTARVEGAVTDVDGQPAARVQVTLLSTDGASDSDAARLQELVALGLAAGTGGTTAADGTFSIRGVAPGTYTVLARKGALGRGPAAPAAGEQAYALTEISVNGEDLSGLAMRLVPGQKMSGRIAFESQARPKAMPRVSVGLRAADSRGVSVTMNWTEQAGLVPAGTGNVSPGASADAFTVEGLIPARYRVSANTTPPGWVLKSATAGGRDVADVPIEIRAGQDVTGVVLTFTDSAAEVSGTLFDAVGRPLSDLAVVLFSTDPEMWFTGSRRVRPLVRPANTGVFTFSGLVAGEYYLAALTEVSAADLADPAFLEQVAPAAIRISVADGERKTQDLKVAGGGGSE